jgi:uncharacterized protein YjdB
LVTTITISPQSASLISGQTQQFTSSATNVNWSIAPAGVGTVSSSGLYTAPASIDSQQSITITATSQANSSISASASVTLSPVSVTVSPATKTLFVGQSQTFAASVTNASTTAVTWSISPANAGSITSAGVYTAPSSIATQQNVTVTAVSQADSSKSATATVTLVPVSLSVSPSTKTLFGGQSQQFSATVTNAGDTGVVWSVIPANVGTISSSGLYTAPAIIASQQTLTIKATSWTCPHF